MVNVRQLWQLAGKLQGWMALTFLGALAGGVGIQLNVALGKAEQDASAKVVGCCGMLCPQKGASLATNSLGCSKLNPYPVSCALFM